MRRNLIVIATNNGATYLPKCLESLGTKHPILVVDTGSTDQASLELVQQQPLYALLERGYTTGAYLHAYKYFPARHYLFMQDSMVSLVPDALDPFKDLDSGGAVAWATFDMGFDTPAHETWAKSLYTGQYPSKGIFGPIFYTSRSALNRLDKAGLLPPVPKDKLEAQTCERLWSWAFNNAGLPVACVGGDWKYTDMMDGRFPIFQKEWAGRS